METREKELADIQKIKAEALDELQVIQEQLQSIQLERESKMQLSQDLVSVKSEISKAQSSLKQLQLEIEAKGKELGEISTQLQRSKEGLSERGVLEVYLFEISLKTQSEIKELRQEIEGFHTERNQVKNDLQIAQQQVKIQQQNVESAGQVPNFFIYLLPPISN